MMGGHREVGKKNLSDRTIILGTPRRQHSPTSVANNMYPLVFIQQLIIMVLSKTNYYLGTVAFLYQIVHIT